MKYNGITIHKRKNDGYWYFRIYDISTNKYQYFYNKNQKELYKTLKQINIKKYKTIDNNLKPTLREWIDTYLLKYKIGIIKETSLKEIKNEFKNLKPLENKKLNKISSLELKTLIYDIKAARQKQKLYIHLNDLFEKAIKNNILKNNPITDIPKPKYVQDKEPKSFTQKQQNEIVKRLYQDKQYALLFCIFQGTRIGEALALKKEDIKQDEINISHTANIHNNIRKELNTPKTKKSIRTIPLFNETKKILKLCDNTSEYIFNENYKNICKYFNKLMSELKLTGYTVHSTRHTFATRALEKGVSIKTISKWLGHSTTTITSNIYLHINKDFEQSEINKINQ